MFFNIKHAHLASGHSGSRIRKSLDPTLSLNLLLYSPLEFFYRVRQLPAHRILELFKAIGQLVYFFIDPRPLFSLLDGAFTYRGAGIYLGSKLSSLLQKKIFSSQ